jgi:hypothetical protein
MVKVKSREEVLVIIQQIEECESLEALGRVFEQTLPHPRMLRKAFLRRIKQIHQQK